MYDRTTPRPLNPARRIRESRSHSTIRGLGHRCHDRSIVELCASSRLGVLRPCLFICNNYKCLGRSLVAEMFETYRMLTSVLEGWRRACTRKRSCHPHPTQGISHWAKSEQYGWCLSGCSSTPIVSVCPQVQHFRYHKWPQWTRSERNHLENIKCPISVTIPRVCACCATESCQEGSRSPPAAVTSRFPSGETSQL